MMINNTVINKDLVVVTATNVTKKLGNIKETINDIKETTKKLYNKMTVIDTEIISREIMDYREV